LRVLAAGAVLLTVLLLGAALGITLRAGWGSAARCDAGPVDTGFAQDMSVHHRQAVLMAGWARERSTDPAIRSLAFDIETSQLEQIGRMQGWLSVWNAPPLAPGRPMSWMAKASSMPGMAHGNGPTGSGPTGSGPTGSGPTGSGPATMPGMASPAELKRLRTASGAPFDVLFLQLMLRHHQGGLPMARYAAEHAKTPQVRNLAQQIAASQGSEAEYLTQLLAQRGAQPLPPPG
jgi:uncharacterized protein (DUF305 family)